MEGTRPTTRSTTRATSAIPIIKMRPKPARGMRKTHGSHQAPKVAVSRSMGSAAMSNTNIHDNTLNPAMERLPTADVPLSDDFLKLPARPSLATRLASEEPPFTMSSEAGFPSPRPPPPAGPSTRSASKRKRTTSRATTPSEATPRASKQSRFRTASPSYTPRAEATSLDAPPTSDSEPGPSSPLARLTAVPSKRRISTRSRAMDVDEENILTVEPTPATPAARRRGSTPVRYEPPREKFASPEVVVVNAPTPQSTRTRRKMTRMVLQIKKEPPPEIDLNEPLLPPSPTDDPLLLTPRKEPLAVVPEESPHEYPTLATPISTARPLLVSASSVPPESPHASPLDLSHSLSLATIPPRSPSMQPSSPMSHTSLASPPPQPATLDADLSHWSPPSSSPARPVMPWAPPDLNGGWTPSPIRRTGRFNVSSGLDGKANTADDAPPEKEGDGEFTGHFWSVMVPTKPDPPTKEMVERMEKWGRPVSPFPREEGDVDTSFEVGSVGSREGNDIGWSTPKVEAVDRAPPRFEIGDQSMEGLGGNISIGASVNSSMEDGREPIPTAEEDQRVFERYSATPQPESEYGDHKRPRFSLEEQEEEEAEERSIIRELSREPGLDSDDDDDENIGVANTWTHGPLYDQNAPFANINQYDDDEEEEAEEEEESEDEYENMSEDEIEGEIDPDMIKITSEDPQAAARAAAILQMYDYDCAQVVPVRRHLRSHRSVGDISREARRRGALSAGIQKSRASQPMRPDSVNSFAGDHMYDHIYVAGGTPEPVGVARSVASTEREPTVEIESPQKPFAVPMRASSNPLQTPGPQPTLPPTTWGNDDADQAVVPRAWVKNDWKLLDACFTDERIEVARRYGMPDGTLADVDLVDMTDVVDRFMDLPEMRGLWDRTNTLSRARALQKKQRSGKIAPPTPVLGGRSAFSPFAAFEVPDFTPAASRSRSPVAPAYRFSEKPKLAPTLYAPRYSHLMEEAVAYTPYTPEVPGVSVSGDISMDESDDYHIPASVEPGPSAPTDSAPPQSLGGRMKNYLFSYLRSPKPASKFLSKPDSKLSTGLPLPPKEFLERPRPVQYTPAKGPAPRDLHPRDIIELHPVSPPPTRSPTPDPFANVSLRPVSPPPTPPPAPLRRTLTRTRTSSGASVRDLVRAFEEMEERSNSMIMREEEARQSVLRRTKSHSDIRGRMGVGNLASAAAAIGSNRAVWRP